MACATTAIAVAGVVAAVVLTRADSDPLSNNTATRAAAGQRETVTVFTPAPTTPVATTDATTTTAIEPTADRGRLVLGTHYAFRIPAGWVTESSGVYHRATRPGDNSYTESRWHASGDEEVSIHIDYTTGFGGEAGVAARGVRDGYHKGPNYRERSFGPVTLDDGREVWRWGYVDGPAPDSVERVDYFMTGCNNGYAMVGAAPTARYADVSPVFTQAVASLKPRC